MVDVAVGTVAQEAAKIGEQAAAPSPGSEAIAQAEAEKIKAEAAAIPVIAKAEAAAIEATAEALAAPPPVVHTCISEERIREIMAECLAPLHAEVKGVMECMAAAEEFLAAAGEAVGEGGGTVEVGVVAKVEGGTKEIPVPKPIAESETKDRKGRHPLHKVVFGG